MMFWDSSAIIPLCIEEPQTDVVRNIIKKDGAIAVWWGSLIECYSAFQLSAALIWAGKKPKGHHFICFDLRLREAARKEGFVPLPTDIS